MSDEDVAPAEVGPTFRFKVKLGTLRMDRIDGEEEDDFKSFALVRCLGDGAEPLWYHESSEDEGSRNLGKTSITNGFEAAYNYTRNSPKIPLRDDCVGALASCTLAIDLYKGSERDSTKDTLFGSFTMSLASLLDGTEISCRQDFEAPEVTESSLRCADYKGSLEVSVTGDAALEDFCRGSRILSIGGISITTPPAAWAPTVPTEEGVDPTDEQLLEALADPENPVSKYRYILEVKIPAGSAAQVSDTSAGAGAGASDDAEVAEEPEAAAPAPDSLEEQFGAFTTVTVRGGELSYAEVMDAFGSKLSEDADVGEGGDTEGEAESKEASSDSKGEDEGEGEEAEPSPPAPSREFRVDFSAASTVYLSKSAILQLTQMMEAGVGLVAVVKRFTTAVNDTTGELEYLDEDMLSRGEASFALDDLLSPGNTTAQGEYNITPKEATEAEREAAAAAAAEREAAAAKGAKGKKKPPPKKGKGKAEPAPVDEAPPSNVHEDSGAIIASSLTLDQPIVLRPPTPPAPQLKPQDLIPSRPEPLKAPPGVAASAEFREDVALVIHSIAEQYVKICRELPTGGDRETRRRTLLTELNSSGLYHSIKERLKRSAVRIVRERFNKTDSLADGPARDAFISQLYTYLVGQAHRAMNAAFTEAEAALDTRGRAVPPTSTAGKIQSGVSALLTAPAGSPTARAGRAGGAGAAAFSRDHSTSKSDDAAEGEESEPDRLGRIAAEREAAGDHDRAAAAHQSRVAWCERQVAQGLLGAYNPVPWHEYALYLLRRGNLPKAGECLRECIAIDPTRQESLMLLGCLAAQQSDAVAANTHLCAAVVEATKASAASPSAALCHILHAVAQEKSGNMEGSSASITAAVQALRDSGAAKMSGRGVDPVVDAVVAPSEPYLKAAEYLLDSHLLELAETALLRAAATLADQKVPSELRVSLRLQESRHFFLLGGASLSLALERIDSALEIDRECRAAWAVKGRILLATGDEEGARTALELAIGDWNDASTSSTDTELLLSLASIYLASPDVSLLGSSKEVYLRAAKRSGWSIAWLGAGKAALKAGERVEAEAGLNEANVKDNHNAEVWAWLSLLCMTESPVPRELEGAQALDQSLKLRLDPACNAALLVDIAAAFSAAGKHQVAEKILLRVTGAVGDSNSRLLLGQALSAQEKHEEAVEEFKQVLAIADHSADVHEAVDGACASLDAVGKTSESVQLRARYA